MFSDITQKKKHWLYIPMETKNRDLHGKLLLSLFAAERGFHIVLGHKGTIMQCLPYMPKGTYLHYGVVQNYVKTLQKVRKLGHRCVAFDEEGLAIYNREIYLRYRVSPEALKLVDTFFGWGKYQIDIIHSEYPWSRDILLETGSPRFDLLRSDFRSIFGKDAQNLIDKYGDYILINTNFGPTNHYNGPDFYFNSLRDKKMIVCQEDELFHRNRLDHQTAILRSFVGMLKDLSKDFPDHTIIVRPHPSENRQFWEDIAVELPNVRVIHQGNVIPWLKAAKVVIHNGCTTAIESFLLGTPAIAYRQVKSEEFDIFLPNALSYDVSNSKELKDCINNIICSEEMKNLNKDQRRIMIVKEHITAIDGDFSCERIINSIESIIGEKGQYEPNITDRLKIKILQLRLFTLNQRPIKHGGKSYVKHKFGELTLDELEEYIAQFKKISRRFDSIKVSKIGNNIFYIRSDN